jgi:subtilisin family serine protease
MAKKRRAAAAGKGSGAVPKPTDTQGRTSVLIEFRQQPGASVSFAMSEARHVDTRGFTLDEEFEPVRVPRFVEARAGAREAPLGVSPAAEATYVVRGTVSSPAEIKKLQSRPEVAAVWLDTPIAPFPRSRGASPLRAPLPEGVRRMAAAGCPIPPCDCDPGTPKGTIADVAIYLGADRIWAAGFRGTGIVVGVLDSGITAQGRPVKPGETPQRIPRVIGGWPTDDWGTESSQWGDHGNMCGTDVLGMAPDAQLYDLRIAGGGGSPGTISRALQAFNWAISQHRLNGTPQVLTNSWGIFQESWDPTYARDPNHPFTRKVVEAITEGIHVLFAAGNCGDTCPDGRCGADVGTGRSIWGANGHPSVMTVGAVNRLEEFIGYSSRGPATLDPNKPDFCSISHFTGYFDSDSGTSAATPILAGVVALLKQANPTATQDELKSALRATAKDIGAAGFDVHAGAGIVQGFAAFQNLTTAATQPVAVPARPRRRAGDGISVG